MDANENLFDAAIVNEDGIIENVLVFDNEDTMREFGAKRLAEGQGIGDVYMTPEEYATQRQKDQLKSTLTNQFDTI